MADNTLHSSARANWLERRFAPGSRVGPFCAACVAWISGFLTAACLMAVIPAL